METIMTTTLTIRLPTGTSAEEAKALESQVKGIAEVKAAGVQQTRGLDAATIAVWLTIAKPAADLAMTMVERLIAVIRGKGLSGVVIELPNNAGTVKVDSASAGDMEKLLKAVRGG
jgi:hypothetical protein